MLIDTHCHLCDPAFDGDREAALERAWGAGLAAVVEIADSEGSWAKARSLSEHASGRVWWSAGLHPYHAGRFDPDLCRRLADALRHPRAVAVGEIGLDYYKHCDVGRPRQIEVFEKLARAGSEAGKPLVLHCREADPGSTDAQRDMLAVLKGVFSGPGAGRGVMHCFQGTAEFARDFVEMGFLIGVDGPVTYPKAEGLRAVLRDLSPDVFLLETDSPYLPPQAHRGRRNEPSFLPAVAEALARVKGSTVAEVAASTSRNARRLLALPA